MPLQITFREPMNGLTHFIGALLSVAALVLLLVYTGSGKPWHIVSFSIYGASMLMLYSASTLYHWLSLSDENIKIMRKLDHIMIFFMIAGSYTPMALVVLRGGWGWSIFGVAWGITLIGTILKLKWINMPRKLNVSLYLLMGWMIVIALPQVNKKIPSIGVMWLFIEGIVFSIGAVIYATKKPNFKYFGFHELWHIFVIGGSFAHFWFLFYYIRPLP